MDHHLLLIPPHDKFPITASIAARAGRTMVFARTQMGVDRLVEQLAAVGVRAGALHGGKTQRVRTRTLAEFKEGRMNVLVATDVAARGIHVDGVSLVVHVDPPKDPKDYLHRAGRTARAGESGAVATLVLPKQRRTTLAMMEKAGVAPAEIRVRVGDAALAELTGAREPSGVPVRVEPEPRRDGDRPSRPRAVRRPPAGERRYGDRPSRRPRATATGPTGSATGDRSGGDRRFGDRPTGERGYGDRPQRRARLRRPPDRRARLRRPARTATAAYGDRDRQGERPHATVTGRSGERAATATARTASAASATGRSGERRSYGDRPQRRAHATATGPTGDRRALRRPPQGERAYGDRPQGERTSATVPGDRHRDDRPRATGVASAGVARARTH